MSKRRKKSNARTPYEFKGEKWNPLPGHCPQPDLDGTNANGDVVQTEKWTPRTRQLPEDYMNQGPKEFSAPSEPKFDINDVQGNMKPGSDKQSFSRIKRIYAKGGYVFINVDPTLIPEMHGGKPLQNQMLTVKEAAERARELNRMACVMTAADYKMIMEIVEATIRACKEAQQQLAAPPEKKIIVPGAALG